MDLNLTDACVAKIGDLLAEENNPEIKLRVFVNGGGCSGFTYGFTFDETQSEDDFLIERGDVKVLVDQISYQYLAGATIDYTEELFGSQFSIKNPNAVSTCGCGSSFSI